MCLRRSCRPPRSPRSPTSSRAWSTSRPATSPSRGGGPGRRPAKASARSREQPRPTQAAPSHHHAVGAGLAHHGQRIRRGPDVAVAQHRQRHRLLEPGHRRPVGPARVELGRGAGVQRDGGRTLVLGHPAGVEVGEQLVVDAQAHLDGDRDRHRPPATAAPMIEASRRGRTGHGGATAVAGHLADRAAEVEVDVVDPALAHQARARPPRWRPGRCRRAGWSGGTRRGRRRPGPSCVAPPSASPRALTISLTYRPAP